MPHAVHGINVNDVSNSCCHASSASVCHSEVWQGKEHEIGELLDERMYDSYNSKRATIIQCIWSMTKNFPIKFLNMSLQVTGSVTIEA